MTITLATTTGGAAAPTRTPCAGGDLLLDPLARARRHGPRPALIDPTGATLDHAGLTALVQEAAASLAALGTTSGAPHPTRTRTRHLVHLRPACDVDFVVAWLACLAAGHPVLLTDRDALAAAYGASAERHGGAWRATGRRAPDLHPDLRLLLSTSGSTGSPRLVRLSADNLASNAAAIAHYLDLRDDDVAVTTLPLDYCYGLSVLHSHLVAGGSVLLDERPITDPGLWQAARRAGVTGLAGVPSTFDLLATTGWPELPRLRRVTQAGGRLPADRVRSLAARGEAEGWDLVVMYGQTEATARMTYLPPHLAARRPESVGVAVPGGEVRVDAAPGEVGEVVYRGPNVMMGYATAPADLALGATTDELRTGDLGRIGDDGLLEIVGRTSRFAKVLGHRVDLDRVGLLLRLAGHETLCAEADDGRGVVVALLDPDDDRLRAREVTAEVARETGLPPALIRVVAVEALPLLPNGKPDLVAVAGLCSAGDRAADAAAQAGRPVTADDLGRLYARVLGRAHVPASASFVDLQGDSLSYVEVALRLEDLLGELPHDWPRRSIESLATARTPRRTRPARPARLARLETGIALRAAAIVMIVGSHTDLWVLLGGAHVLLAVAGANLARFHLLPEPGAERLRRIGRGVLRIAVPSVLWLTAVALLSGDLPWRTVLLVNQVLGADRWSEPAWHYWFIEVLVWLTLAVGVLTSLPWVRELQRRRPFALPLALTAAAVGVRLVAEARGYDGDVMHAAPFVAWLLFGGWAASAVGGEHAVAQRIVLSGVLLVGALGFTGSEERDLIIALGVLALVWTRTLPWPRLLLRPAGALARASLWIYLTHWQVYPWFEDRAPLAGLLLSLAVGIATERLVQRVRDALVRSEHRLRHPAPNERPESPRTLPITEERQVTR